MNGNESTEAGEWKTAACWHNCGGRCVNKVLVRDGVVVRQKSDDTHEDSPDWPQQRACQRGHAQRRQVFSPDRLRYPMKRKHWTPDDPHGELRGVDEWERISWDEAFAYAARGLSSAKERFGNRSILLLEGWTNHEVARTLKCFGGYTGFWDTASYGAWQKTPFLIGFHHDNKQDQTVNDRFDLRNADTIVMLSMNPAWSAPGSQMLNYLEAKKAGARFIAIDPMYSETAATLGADWIPIRPATDTAFLLGLAHAMIDQDAECNLIDHEFLDACTVGFDADHMPDDAREQRNFRDYVLGAYDGVPKTPEWASGICGVDPERIRLLARQMGKRDKVAFLASTASARVNDVDNLPQLIMTIGAMGGHIGTSGNMTGTTMHCTSGNGGPALVRAGSDGLPPLKNAVGDRINGNEVWDAVIDGSYTSTGVGMYDAGVPTDIDIHVIYHCGGNKIQTNVGMTRAIEAHRKVDMVVSQAQFMTTAARYSDIVFPLTSQWERPDGLFGGTLGHKSNREMMVAFQNIIPPMYECRSDQEVALGLGEALGIDGADIYPFGPRQQYFNELASMRVLDDDGETYVPAVDITTDDIAEIGAQGQPQTGKLPYAELKRRGVYQVKRQPGDKYGYIAFEDFRRDPAGHPLDTPSGKLEIYCQRLADTISAMGWGSVDPIPVYKPVRGGFEDTRDAAGRPTEFPLQIYDIHYPRRAHSVFDNVDWLREAWPSPLFINTTDARAAGIGDGDTVLVTTVGGRCLRPACVTERLMPGVVALPHGAWVDIDADGIDRAGADNLLLPPVPNGAGVSGYNSAVCRIALYDGKALPSDVELPVRLPQGGEGVRDGR